MVNFYHRLFVVNCTLWSRWKRMKMMKVRKQDGTIQLDRLASSRKKQAGNSLAWSLDKTAVDYCYWPPICGRGHKWWWVVSLMNLCCFWTCWICIQTLLRTDIISSHFVTSNGLRPWRVGWSRVLWPASPILSQIVRSRKNTFGTRRTHSHVPGHQIHTTTT